VKSRLDGLAGTEELLLVLDASVVINLLATDRGGSNVDSVLAELETNQLLAIRELGAQGLEDFAAMTEGTIRDTLGDGEAATLALAAEIGAVAVIDENKAARIARERYRDNSMTLLNSLDLLACQAVQQAFRDDLTAMVLRALQLARMRVPIPFEAWVLDLIGPEEFQRCTSIRLRARNDARAR